MKPILLAVIAVTLCIPVVAQSSAWQLDPLHSSAQFAVRHMGISTVRGTFTKLNGTARYDAADPKNNSVEVTIDTASGDTRVEMRDNDLRSDHFFDAQKFPNDDVSIDQDRVCWYQQGQNHWGSDDPWHC